ncbi:hypothetical protein D3C81_1627850 [compost metagenome]
MVTLRVEHTDFTVQFVVNLPAHHTRVIAIMLGKLSRDSGTELPVFRTAVVIVTPHAMLQSNSVIRNIQDFGITLSEPGGWGGSRCAQNHL